MDVNFILPEQHIFLIGYFPLLHLEKYLGESQTAIEVKKAVDSGLPARLQLS